MRYQKIIKHGNSLAVVIPVEQLREMALRWGDYVEVIVHSKGAARFSSATPTLMIWKVKRSKFR